MVVGKTGVGKSTLIQGIAGKRIHTVSHTSTFSGETATKTVYGAQDALANFEIGHGKVSKTRSLSAYLRKDLDNDRDYVYLDSPGLEDTRGVEMDIVTSSLLSQVAKRCKSLRFVILIHCASLLEDRGNAFRSIIKFAKRFVQDFVESKFSFMFLFTHTDEIGMSRSSSADDSKKRVQDEIVHIAEAATDEDISKALWFIGKSLKKDYPFANILHPLDTDYKRLACAIEEKLQPLENLDSASVCNLTLSSKMKLEVAVQNLLQRLQVTLNSSPKDITPIKDIQKTFHYLNEYIGVPSVCDAARRSEAMIQDHEAALKRSIESEYDRWTNPSSDFTEGNAVALKDALKRLEQFDSTFSAERWVQSKADTLSALKTNIVTRAKASILSTDSSRSCKFGRTHLKSVLDTMSICVKVSWHSLRTPWTSFLKPIYQPSISCQRKRLLFSLIDIWFYIRWVTLLSRRMDSTLEMHLKGERRFWKTFCSYSGLGPRRPRKWPNQTKSTLRMIFLI